MGYRAVRTTNPDAVGMDITWPDGSIGRFMRLDGMIWLEARNGASVDLGSSSTLDGLLGVAADLPMPGDRS